MTDPSDAPTLRDRLALAYVVEAAQGRLFAMDIQVIVDEGYRVADAAITTRNSEDE